MGIALNDNIQLHAPKPVDARYINNMSVRPDTVTVLANIPLTERNPGLTVNIANEEWRFKDGVQDSDLVPKTNGAGVWEIVTTNDTEYTPSVNQYVQCTNSLQDVTIKLPNPADNTGKMIAVRKANDSKYSIIFDGLDNGQGDIADNLHSLIHFTKVDEYDVDYLSYYISEDDNYIYQRGWTSEPANQKMSRVLKSSPHTIDHLGFPTGEDGESNEIDNDNNYVYYINYTYGYLCRVDKTDWTSTGFSKACPNYTMNHPNSVKVINNEIRCTDYDGKLFIFDRTGFSLSNTYSIVSNSLSILGVFDGKVFMFEQSTNQFHAVDVNTKTLLYSSATGQGYPYNSSIDEENKILRGASTPVKGYDTDTLALVKTFPSGSRLRSIVAGYDGDLYGGKNGYIRGLDVNTLTTKEEIDEGTDSPALSHTNDRLYMTVNIERDDHTDGMVKYYIGPNKINFSLSRTEDTVTLISNGTKRYILNEFDTTLSETPRQGSTIDGTQTELFILNQDGRRLNVPRNFQLIFTIDVSGINQKSGIGCLYRFNGKIENDSAGNMRIVNIEKNIIYKEDTTRRVELDIDTINEALIPKVIGSALSGVYWTAMVTDYAFIRLT